MKKLLIVLFILIVSAGYGSGGQMIVCDIPAENTDTDTTNDVVKVVVKTALSTITAPYLLTDEKDAVILVELTGSGSQEFEFAFENAQGRRSEFIPFYVSPAPGGCTNLRIEN